MSKLVRISVLLFLILTPAVFADDRLLDAAMQAYAKKDYARSADLFAKYFESGEPDATDFYNAACSSALAGRSDAAISLLEKSIAAGYGGWEHLGKDSDLEALHAHSRWTAIVAAAKRNGERDAKLWSTAALDVPWAEDLPAEVKIAGLSKLWSEVRYNFANFDLVPDLDWDALYLETIPRVTASQSTLEYYRILQEMIAGLRDGHSNVWPPMAQFDRVHARPPIRTRLVGENVIVTRVAGEMPLVAGDEIVAIDGVPVHEWARTRVRPWQSASTPQDLDARTYDYSLMEGAIGTNARLAVRRVDGRTIDVDVPRLGWKERNAALQRPPFELHMLPGGIAHVVLNSFDSDQAALDFESHRDEILGARGVIFDVRENGGGSSSVGHRILEHFNPSERVISRWTTRQYRAAFRAWKRPHGVASGEVRLGASGTQYRGPVALLTSARTYSAAEDFAVAFRATGAGSIVGEATGGSTGQPVSFSLPGGGTARVCAKHDVAADGTEFVGVGVKPDVVVAPSRGDIAAGRDVVLEKAVAIVGSAGDATLRVR